MHSKRVLIMAAGTGGHVFPALAIARQLQAQGARVEWLGTPNGMENRLLAETNIPLHCIAAKGLKGKGLGRLVRAPWMLLRSLWQSLVIVRKFKPDCVIGMGGYVSGPGGIAAKLLARRLVLHEQNAVPGVTNKLLARIADQVLEAFPHTFAASSKLVTVGNPVRADIEALGALPLAQTDTADPLRLLVLGGSQGAQALNEVLPRALVILKDSSDSQIVLRHQTGRGQLEKTEEAYAESGLSLSDSLDVSAFIDDMAQAYLWADLVLCRSGASTVSEIAVAGKPALLVPYPYHKDQQQLYNARWLCEGGAAVLIEQKQLDPETLANHLAELAKDRSRLHGMALAAHKLAARGADKKIAAMIMGPSHVG